MNTTGMASRLKQLVGSFRRSKTPTPLTCGWAPHYGSGDRPLATSLVILARPCGCHQDPVSTCSSCIGVLMDALADVAISTHCQSCGERNDNRIVRVVDLDR